MDMEKRPIIQNLLSRLDKTYSHPNADVSYKQAINRLQDWLFAAEKQGGTHFEKWPTEITGFVEEIERGLNENILFQNLDLDRTQLGFEEI